MTLCILKTIRVIFTKNSKFKGIHPENAIPTVVRNVTYDCRLNLKSGQNWSWSCVEWCGVVWSGVEWCGVVWSLLQHSSYSGIQKNVCCIMC